MRKNLEINIYLLTGSPDVRMGQGGSKMAKWDIYTPFERTGLEV